jgi:CHAT domain-containing protein/tetratricopeptide (TPR) repeat protein
MSLWLQKRRSVVVLAMLLTLVPGKLRANDNDDVKTVITLLAAKSLKKQGKYAEAVQEYQKAIGHAERGFGPNHVCTASCLNTLGELYIELCQYTQAEIVLQRSLAIREAQGIKNDPLVASSLYLLGYVYQAQGRYGKAEAFYRRALAIHEARLGKNHPQVAQDLNNLAALCHSQGRYAESEALFQRSLTIKEAIGKNDLNVAYGLNNLGALYSDQGQFGRAEAHFQRCLAIREKGLGKDHPLVAITLQNLGTLYSDQRQFGKAKDALQRGLAILEAKVGKNHPGVAHGLNSLAVVYQEQVDFDKAEHFFQRSLTIYEGLFGQGHPDVAKCLENLAILAMDKQCWKEAARYFDRARRSTSEHLQMVLPALSPQEQLSFLHCRFGIDFHIALSMALLRRGDPGTPERTAAWVLNGKGLTQEALAEPLRVARAGNRPELRTLFSQLVGVRNQLARLTLALPRPDQAKQHQARLKELGLQEQQLTRELGQKSGYLLGRKGWMGLAGVRKAVPEDAVFIDIVRFPVFDFQAKGGETRWQGFRYVAWVIPPYNQGQVHIVDLGPADRIDAAVRAGRRAVQPDPRTLAGDKEAKAEKILRDKLMPLTKLILAPLHKQIAAANHWIISPDASLWLVPWSALPLADGSYAVEKYRVSFVVSGRELVDPGVPMARRPSGQGAMVFADPDFDMKLGSIERNRSEVRGWLPERQLPLFERLAGTAAEARAIVPWLKRCTGQKPHLQTGKKAREESIKSLHGPRMVILSTHGYFLEDQHQAVVPALAGLERRGLKMTFLGPHRPKMEKIQVLENPLLRCGLALAGANQRDKAPEGADDGILTGLEIVGTDLRGTELVVLSACETGLGQVNVGEGVAGLRQAFQLAGAQAVVATLWQIPDKETTALMTAFFEHLAAMKGKAEALRQAQLEIIQMRRAKGKAAHPCYWAAFTLTGKWQ